MLNQEYALVSDVQVKANTKKLFKGKQVDRITQKTTYLSRKKVFPSL